MIEVDYYLNTSKQWMIDFAESFSKSSGTKITFANNKLIVPSSVGMGRFEYYELNENLGMLCVDIIFQQEISLRKKQLEGSNYYALVFFLSKYPVKVLLNDSKGVVEDFIKSVALTSHAFNSSMVFPKDVPLRYVQIFAHKSWGIKNLTGLIPLKFARLKEFVSAQHIHTVANFDIKSYELVHEILELDTTRVNLIELFEGYACQLIALFFNNLKKENDDKGNTFSVDEMRIVELKEKQEQTLTDIATISKAAEACFMSKTKFASIFNTLFKENYGEYFMHKKMEKAKELLDEGYSAVGTASTLGYTNLNHFGQTFKKYFGVMPGAYKKLKKK